MKKTQRDVQKIIGHNDGVFTFENNSNKVQMRTINKRTNKVQQNWKLT